MSDKNLEIFQQRLNSIEKTYKKAGRHRSGSRPKDTARIAKKQKQEALAATYSVKNAVSTQMGADVYDEKVQQYSQGTQVEQVASMALQRGPVMQQVQGFLAGILTSAQTEQPPEDDAQGAATNN